MLQLPNGCYCSELKVHPKNWLQLGASLKKDWYIWYRYYDPAFPNPKLRIVKGMNCFDTLGDRRDATKALIGAELELLQEEGYNPITNVFVKPASQLYEVHPDTPFIKALRHALTKVEGARGTIIDMGSMLKGVEKSAKELHFERIPISQITRKYIKLILEQCSKNNTRWSAHRHNKYRTYLSRLFKELIEMEATEINPIRDISKAKESESIRIMLTPEERKKINEVLYKNQYPFWRAMQVFFHSGSRETEIMNVQGKHVNLQKQECVYTVRKGRVTRLVIRPIKDIVLHLWQELMKDCGPEDYILSVGLVPGPKAIRPDQLGKRWLRHVKKKMNIKADFYKLKHLNTTEMMEELSKLYSSYDPAADVAKLNGHTSTAMVVKIYDRDNSSRKNDRIKKVGNTFG